MTISNPFSVRYSLIFRKAGLSLLLGIGVHSLGLAQCAKPSQFRDKLKYIDSGKISEQDSLLRHWCTEWIMCGYPKDSTYVDGVLQLGLLCLNRKEFSEARQLSQNVIDLYLRPKFNLRESDASKAYYRQGIAFHYLGEEEKKMEVLRKAIRTADNSPEGKLWAANAHLYLGFSYFAKGDYQQALLHAAQGEVLAREIQNNITISKILQQKAQVLSEQKRFGEARDALEDGIGLLKNDTLQQRSVASQYRLLGFVYKDLNQPKTAIDCLKKAFQIAQVQHHKPSEFAISLGYLYYEFGNYAQAIRHYQLASTLDQSPYSQGLIFDNLGAAYWKLGQFRRAFSFYQLGIAELVAGFRPTKLGQLPRAQSIRLITQKLYLLTTIQDKADTWLDYARRAPDSLSKKVRLRNALRTYALADSMIDYMRYEHEGEGSKLFWRQQILVRCRFRRSRLLQAYDFRLLQSSPRAGHLGAKPACVELFR